MIKKTITIKYGGKPIFVVDVRDMEIGAFLELKGEADDNLAELVKTHEAEKEELRAFRGELNELKAEIAFVKGE